MAHRFSNTQAQRERVYTKSSAQASRDIVDALSERDFDLVNAVGQLDCYPEVAKELAQAIIAVIREENL